MAGPLKLSKPYDSTDDAAMGGFKKILGNGVQWHTNEFGFWVILKLSADKKTGKYHYTEPESNGPGHVDMTLPEGVSVFANCHSHPRSYKTGDFSTGDKRAYVKLRKARPGIAYYLLNPSGEIRRAIREGEFPAGVTLNWNNKITP
jgi:hypothetical protein